MTRVWLAGLLGGIAAFAWGPITWLALPFHTAALHSFPQPDDRVKAFFAELPCDGVYHFPGFPQHTDGTPPTTAEMTAATEKMKAGPNISKLVYRAGGRDPLPPQNFVIGLLLHLFAATIAAWLLHCAVGNPLFANYLNRVGFAAAPALFGVATITVPEWLWWGYPLEFGVLTVADPLIAWLLAALVIAGLVTPRAAPR